MGVFSEELDSLWDFGDPAASERRFNEAARGDHRAEALTQLARAVGLQKRFDEALQILDEAEALGGGEIIRARVALERGRILRDQGLDAKPEFQKARSISEANGLEFYAIDAVHMLAICETDEAAIRLNEEAIEMAAKSESERARQWQASLLNNLGWSYFDLGDFQRALNCFEKAVPLREQRGQMKEAGIAKWCVGKTLRELGRVDQALEIQYELLSADEVGYAHEETGECLLALGREQAARPYLAEAAVRLRDEIEGKRLKRLADLGCDSTFGKVSANAIRFTRAPRAGRDAIWNMVATPEGIALWLGAIDGDLTTVTGSITILIENDSEDAVACRVLDYLPNQALTLTWEAGTPAESILSLEVADRRLFLKHRNPSDLATYGAAWHSALDLIQHLLEGKTKDTFIENYQHLLPEYRRLVSRQETR